ncbi:serine protease HTRA3-like isoform X1 [Salvelinus alpinus]|uniref:serine protease HTRA3-like isoform X1 n=1 Tax=Salvelinus alpinus TaxID=8036 RepID=UPI0039FBAF13
MQVLLFATVIYYIMNFVGAEPKPKCPERCDVSTCPSPSCAMGYVPDRCNCCLVCAQGESDPCGRKDDLPCGDGLECKHPAGKRLAKGFCQCKLGHKVCGSDGITYGNVCQLKAQSRKALQQGLPAINSVQKGPCEINNNKGTSHPTSPRYKFNFIADVVEKIAPAVVHIELFLRHPLFGRNVPLSSGSGFVMSDTGLIVTNAHVVSSTRPVSGRQQLKVQMHNGDVYEATIKDIDKKSDIATIKVNPLKKLPVLLLGHSADLRPGEFVVAIGSPFSLQNTVTTGIVSTAQRDGKELGIRDSDMDYIQTDAIINYGNSGGPLVNLDGEVIGISCDPVPIRNTLLSCLSDCHQDGEVIGINTLKVAAGISFAIPSDRITRFLEESMDKQSKGRPAPPLPSDRTTLFLNESMDKQSKEVRSLKKRFIGIKMLTINPALVEELKQQNPDFPDVSSGIYVHEVVPHSPAQKGGIRDGDIIAKLNGRPLLTTADLQGALTEETALLLEVRRGNDDLLFNIQPDVIMQ